MKTLIKAGLVLLFPAFIASCTNSGANADLKAKKEKLDKLKEQKTKIDDEITDLQKQISQQDTSFKLPVKPKLVALSTIGKSDFKHYIELQGSVDSKNISYITPTGQGGQIKAIYVKQGDKVHKGQLILKLDNSVAEQNVAAVKQQMGSIRSQLDLAKSVYQRQSNLWAQHIGTEVQLLQAKTNVETLESQLKAVQAQVATAQEQANQANVYSDVNGTVDEVTAHVGESFNGNPLTGGYIKIVNDTNLKITVTVPENYSGKVSKGSKVIVQIPDINKTFSSEISFISEAIGTTNRGFTAEVKVPAGMNLRPNQVATVKILDYTAPNSIVIPVNTLQTGQDGKFVLLATKQGNQLFAKKQNVTVGEFYGDSIQVSSGLQPGEQLITEGYQGVFDGQPVTTSNEEIK